MRKTFFILCFFLSLCTVSCQKSNSDSKQDESTKYNEEKLKEYAAANLFLVNIFGAYYYWIDTMWSRLEQWKATEYPIDAYSSFKHSDDRWGFVSADGDEIQESFQGISTSYGYNCAYAITSLTKDTIAFVVTYVSADTPAAKAGMKRGDVLTKFNGKSVCYNVGDDIDDVNNQIRAIVNEVNSKTSTFTYASTGRTITMTPAVVYENPVLVSKIFDFNSKKVAYLHYTQFDLKAIEDLIREFSRYKSNGVSELILDLRYNGGGYVMTELLLGSMIAPQANVSKGDVFSKDQYNDLLTEYYSGKDTSEKLSFEHTITYSDGTTKEFNVKESNPDLKKLYVIMTKNNSASASELLANSLMPYMDVEIFGDGSYGKTASCVLLMGKDWYVDYKEQLTAQQYKDGIEYASNWCGYVTVAFNVNSLGEAKCCPNGFSIDSDKKVYDNPIDGHQLGDPEETMLAKVLQSAGYSTATKASSPVSNVNSIIGPEFTSNKKCMLPTWGWAISQL